MIWGENPLFSETSISWPLGHSLFWGVCVAYDISNIPAEPFAHQFDSLHLCRCCESRDLDNASEPNTAFLCDAGSRFRFRGRTPGSQARKLQDSGGKRLKALVYIVLSNRIRTSHQVLKLLKTVWRTSEIGNRYYRYFTPRDTGCDALDTGSTSRGPHPDVTRFQASKHLLGCPGREVRINA